MNNKPIGVLDSGIGGLSVWQKISEKLPFESTVYVGDSKNIPYGSKKFPEIYSLSKRLVEFLLKKDVKLIVIACNTVTVCCLDKLRADFPGIPIIGIVPVIKTAAEKTRNKKIGILSTEATASSNYQQNLIDNFAKGREVVNIGTGKLVPFVERGELSGNDLEKTVREEVKGFLERGIDTIALGCSHFPFIKNVLQKIMGSSVLILDSCSAVARQTERILINNNALSLKKTPQSFFYTTGNLENFEKVARQLIGKRNNFIYEKTEL